MNWKTSLSKHGSASSLRTVEVAGKGSIALNGPTHVPKRPILKVAILLRDLNRLFRSKQRLVSCVH